MLGVSTPTFFIFSTHLCHTGDMRLKSPGFARLSVKNHALSGKDLSLASFFGNLCALLTRSFLLYLFRFGWEKSCRRPPWQTSEVCRIQTVSFVAPLNLIPGTWLMTAPTEVRPDLCAWGVHSDLLHLLHSPLSHWRHEAEVTWLRQVVSKEPRTVWQGSQPCFLLWKSMCAAHKELPPLSLSFRVGKILSASALANIRGLSHSDCEFCGSSESDTRHLVDDCPAFSHTRDNHGYTSFRDAPLLTRCTGIPSLPAPPTLDVPEEGPGPTNATKDSVFFTDGSAVSPDLPAIRAASWSIVVAHPDGTFPLVRRGLLPGRIQTIGRAELFAFLVLLRTGARAQFLLIANTFWTGSINSARDYSMNWTGFYSRTLICGRRSCLGW